MNIEDLIYLLVYLWKTSSIGVTQIILSIFPPQAWPTHGVIIDMARLTHKNILYKTICNHSLLDMCSTLSLFTSVKTQSYNYPVILNFDINDTIFAAQFKFMQMWTLHEQWHSISTSCWDTKVVGYPMFILDKISLNPKILAEGLE